MRPLSFRASHSECDLFSYGKTSEVRLRSSINGCKPRSIPGKGRTCRRNLEAPAELQRELADSFMATDWTASAPICILAVYTSLDATLDGICANSTKHKYELSQLHRSLGQRSPAAFG